MCIRDRLDSYCISVSALKQRESLVVIQMWHALGSLKKFGFSIVGEGEGRNAKLADVFSMHRNYTYILTSSRVCAPNFAEAFGYDDKHMKVMTLPRVDKLTDWSFKEDCLRRIYDEYPEFREKKVVVYAPTLRVDRNISEAVQKDVYKRQVCGGWTRQLLFEVKIRNYSFCWK